MKPTEERVFDNNMGTDNNNNDNDSNNNDAESEEERETQRIFFETKGKEYSIGSGNTFSLLKLIITFKQSYTIYVTLSMLNLIFSLTCIVIYIYLTYFPGIIMRYNVFFWVTFIFHIYFIFDFSMDLTIMIVEKNVEFLSVLFDVLSIFPFFAMRFVVGMKFDLTNQIDVVTTSMVCFRIHRINCFKHLFKSDVNREIYFIICSLITLLVTSTILINVCENSQKVGKYWLFLERDCSDCDGPNDSFHNSFFFVMITLATIGYGSTVETTLGRCLIIMLIIIQVISIPSMCANLMTMLSSKSVYARRTYKKVNGVDFILITGNISMLSIDILLQEYFHPDHGLEEKHVLLLLNHEPEPYILKLMQKYQNLLFYYEGNCLKLNDLERCCFKEAKMIVLLCDKQSDDSSAEDARTIFQAMAIKKHLSHTNDDSKRKGAFTGVKRHTLLLSEKIQYDLVPNRLVLQLNLPESEHHFELSISKGSNTDQIICIDELKLSLLAKSCLCPGIITMVSNLITTNNMVGESEEGNKIVDKNKWLNDYFEGKDYEIYKIKLNKIEGKSYTETVNKIYEAFEIILFGINIEKRDPIQNLNMVILSPVDYTIPLFTDIEYQVSGYILAKDQGDANKVQTYIDNVLVNSLKDQKNVITYGNQEEEKNEAEKLEEEMERKKLYVNEKFILAESYHINSAPTPKEKAICTSLQNKLVVKKGHIIICGMCQNMIDFVKPLRGKHIDKTECQTIVILSKDLPDDKTWNFLAYFDELFIVQGDPLNTNDLKKAGLDTASKVVILAPSLSEIEGVSMKRKTDDDKKDEGKSSARKLTGEEEDLLDAKTIFKYNLITKLRKNIYVVIELINPKNVSFLNNQNRSNNDEYLFIKAGMDISLTPSFANGEVYYVNMMDNLVSQTYYNESLLAVLKKLLVSANETDNKLKEFKDLCKMHSSNLYLIDMPSFVSMDILQQERQTFGNVFKSLLLKKKIVALGIYKAYKIEPDEKEKENNKKEEEEGKIKSKKKSSQLVRVDSYRSAKSGGPSAITKSEDEEVFYYVRTSPPNDYPLTSYDKLFVISPYYPKRFQNGDLGPANEDPILKDVNCLMFEGQYSSRDEKRKGDSKDNKKDVDSEGEQKLLKLRSKMIEIKTKIDDVLSSVLELENKAKKQITESIQETIQEITVEKKEEEEEEEEDSSDNSNKT